MIYIICFFVKFRALWQCTLKQLAGCWSWVCISQFAGRWITGSVTCLLVEIEVAGDEVAEASLQPTRVIARSRGRSRLAVRSELADHMIGNRSRSLFEAFGELAVLYDL
ncbi:UNVERIFIED_CONTAM: hypothetical protein Slati_4212200 [Sesamum latifolium]|uniref:Secreted protein n=1 Tax=Sesamum latifolium TaxID=2727402 RepID=A0AAW2TCH3_9LAMI